MPLLIKHPRSTDKNTAARRSNGRKSRGATTPEGKERIRAANLKHGFYSKGREEALVSLGEDPKDLAALIAGAHEQFQPANDFQADLVNHLAGLRWRMRRAERLQESAMVREIQAAESRRHRAALQVRYRYVDISSFLEILCQAVGRPDYFTHPCLIERCTEVMKLESNPGMQAVLQMLLILRRPQRFAEVLPPPMPDAMIDSDWEQMEDMYYEGEASGQPHPEIAVAEGEERELVRADLRERVEFEIRMAKDTWGKSIAEAEAPLTILERDRLALEVHKENTLMRREESTCFREFWRLGTILGKLRDDGERGKAEVGSQETEGRKRKAEGGRHKAESGTSTSEFSTLGEVPTPNSEPGTPNSALPTLDSSLLTPALKNEGDSGDVNENTGEQQQGLGVRAQVLGKSRTASRSKNEPDSPGAASQTREVAA